VTKTENAHKNMAANNG